MGHLQNRVARALPRMERPLVERVRYAAAWYRDGIRVADIAAAAVLTHSQVSVAAVSAGLELRGDRQPVAWISLADVLVAAATQSDQSLQLRFGLQDASLLGVRALQADNRPRQPRALPPPPQMRLMKRCPACKRCEPTESDRSPCCGVAY